jgi:histone-lysine N-methyltransferase SETD3
VFLCYGRHPNLDLLDIYGFLLHDNPHDTALLPVQLVQQTLQQLQQRAHQQQQGERQWRRQQQGQQHKQGHEPALKLSAVDCYVHGSGQPSWQLLQALR